MNDSIERLAELSKSKPDLDSVEAMAKDVWLFLTSDYMPDERRIKKDAFLHEVEAMLETARQYYARKQAVAFHFWCEKNGYKRNNDLEMYALTSEGYVVYPNERVYGLFLEHQTPELVPPPLKQKA